MVVGGRPHTPDAQPVRMNDRSVEGWLCGRSVKRSHDSICAGRQSAKRSSATPPPAHRLSAQHRNNRACIPADAPLTITQSRAAARWVCGGRESSRDDPRSLGKLSPHSAATASKKASLVFFPECGQRLALGPAQRLGPPHRSLRAAIDLRPASTHHPSRPPGAYDSENDWPLPPLP